KEKNNLALSLKLYIDNIITTPNKLFKELDYIKIDTLIINNTFKVIAYNLTKYIG
ncbi:hypothetical protein BU23DRAFT_479870, partial [Bimuria novae-zelandiae CBS 107.79]